MNKIFKNIGLLALTGILFTACNEDDNTGESMVAYSPATITLSTLSPTMIDESAIDTDDASTYQIVIQATLTEPQPVDAVIDLVWAGGTADAADFEGGTITIPAGTTSASGAVSINQTFDPEGDETLIITGTSRANFNVAPFTHEVIIYNDYINNDLNVTLSWEGSGETESGISVPSYCELDFDLLILDNTFSVLGYAAGTGDCPDEGSFGGLPDGTYYLVAELYDNPYEGYPAEFSDLTIPLTLTWTQNNFSNNFGEMSGGNYLLNSADSLDNSGDYISPNGPGLGGFFVTLTVTNGTDYVITPY